MHPLKAWLQRNKITQAQFARLLGTTQQAVSNWVHGQRPTVRTAEKIEKLTMELTKGKDILPRWQLLYPDEFGRKVA